MMLQMGLKRGLVERHSLEYWDCSTQEQRVLGGRVWEAWNDNNGKRAVEDRGWCKLCGTEGPDLRMVRCKWMGSVLILLWEAEGSGRDGAKMQVNAGGHCGGSHEPK